MLPEMNKSLSNKPELHFFLFRFITVVCVFQLMQLHVLKAMRQMQVLGEQRGQCCFRNPKCFSCKF